MILLTPDLRERLLTNGRRRDIDHVPVAKFLQSAGRGRLARHRAGRGRRHAFRPADLGEPELGSFSLSEMQSLRLPFGMRIERAVLFEGLFPISAWAEAA